MAKQIILREDLTIKYDISQEDLNAYAQQIGINFETESHLLWIAKEGLEAAVSPPWCPVDDGKGRVYYYNKETGLSTWDHPADAYYKKLVLLEKQRNSSKLSAHSSESELASLDDMPPLPSVNKKVALDENKDFPINEKIMDFPKKLPKSKSTPPFNTINSHTSLTSSIPKKSLSLSQRSVHFDLDDNSISEEFDFSYEISEKGSPEFENFSNNPMAERIFLIDTNEPAFKMPEYPFNYQTVDSLIMESENVMSPIKEKQETYSSGLKPKIEENIGNLIKESNLGTLSDLSFSSAKLPFSLKSKKNLAGDARKKKIEENITSLEDEILKNEKYKKIEQIKNLLQEEENEEIVKEKARLEEERKEILKKERENMAAELQKLKTDLETEHEEEINNLKEKLADDHKRAMKLIEQNILENNRCEREKLEKNLKLKIELESEELKAEFQKTLNQMKSDLEQKQQDCINDIEKENEASLLQVKNEAENKFQMSFEEVKAQFKSEHQTKILKLKEEYESNIKQFQLDINEKKKEFENSETLKELNLDLLNLEENIKNKQLELADLEEDVGNKQKDLEKLEKTIDNKNTVAEDIESKRDTLESLENTIDGKRDSLEDLERKINYKKNTLSNLAKEINTNRSILEDLEKEIDKAQSIKEEISHQESHLNNLKILTKNEDGQLKSFKVQKESLQEQMETLNKEIRSSQKHLRDLQTEIQGIQLNTTNINTSLDNNPESVSNHIDYKHSTKIQEVNTINAPNNYQDFCDSLNSNNKEKVTNKSSPKTNASAQQKKEEQQLLQNNYFEALMDKINRLEENLLTLETKVNTNSANPPPPTDKNLNDKEDKTEEFRRPSSAPNSNNGVLNTTFCLQLKEELDFYKQKLSVLQLKQASLMSQLCETPTRDWTHKTTVPVVPTKTIWSNLAASPLRSASSLPSLEIGLHESKAIGSLLTHSQSPARTPYTQGASFSIPTHSKFETHLNFPRSISSSIALSRERAFLERQEWQQKISSINDKLKEQYKFTNVMDNMQ